MKLINAASSVAQLYDAFTLQSMYCIDKFIHSICFPSMHLFDVLAANDAMVPTPRGQIL